MPRYEATPSEVSASFGILPAGELELIIGEPKTYVRIPKEGNDKDEGDYGLGFPVTVVKPTAHAGEKGYFNASQGNDIGKAISKQFTMAALGFEINKENENRFNEKYKDADWSFDTDTKQVGEAWMKLKGQHVIVESSSTMAKDGSGKEFQKFSKWRPVK